MVYTEGETYAFGYQAVREKAPSVSGVYTIYTSKEWVYVGESADIRQSLLRHLNDPTGCIGLCGPLSFSFELATAADRGPRQQALIAALGPACNPPEGQVAVPPGR
jgi:hypothetical protein